MISTTDLVKFVRFYGSRNEWTRKLTTSDYNNCIVFAQITEEDNTIKKAIYAGKDIYGTPYLYEFCECGGGTIIVENWNAALEYIESPKAAAGLIVTVATNTTITEGESTYSDNAAGNYIIIYNVEKDAIELIRDDNKWAYGLSANGWHNGEAKVTNGIGSIKEGTPLKQLVEETEGGDLSRIIEKMLFTDKAPEIIITARQSTTNPNNAMDVTFVINSATEVEDYYIKYGKDALSLVTLSKDYIDEHGTKVVDPSTGKITITLPIEGLWAGESYDVIGYADNGTESHSQSTVTTKDYTKPTVLVNTTNANLIPHTADNYLTLVLDENDIVINQNDYTLKEGTNIKYIVKDAEGEVIAEGNSITEVNAALANVDLEYNDNYSVSVSFISESPARGEGEPTEEYKSSEDASASTSIRKTPGRASVTKVTINGTEIDLNDPEAFVEITTNTATVYVEANPAIYNATITAEYNDTTADEAEMAGPFRNTLTVSNILVSEDPQSIIITISDGISEPIEITVQVKFMEEEKVYIASFDAKGAACDKTFIYEGDEYKVSDVYIISNVTPETFYTNATDPNYMDPEQYFEPGTMYNIFNEYAQLKLNALDEEEMPNIYVDPEDETMIYRKYVGSQISNMSDLFLLVPTTSTYTTIEIHLDNGTYNAPLKDKVKPLHKLDNIAVIDEKEYDLYYTTDLANNWYNAATCVWLLIK